MKTLKNTVDSPDAKSQAGLPVTAGKSLQASLQVIRGEMHLSQKAIADVIGISQPAIAQIEQRGNDVKLITLKRYIEAMGGKLSLSIELPEGNSRVFYI